MKKLLSVLAVTALLGGCASFQEAYHLDREYGLASQASFDKIVTYPDYRYVTKQPEGLDGIHAEGIMKVHDDTFRRKATVEDVVRIGIGSSD